MKNFVQIGRVVIIHSGPAKGKFAVIVNIVDHKRVLLDSPQEKGDQAEYTALKRQVYSTRHLRLTKYRLNIRFDQNHDVITSLWAKHNLTGRLLATKYMIRKLKSEKKQNLTDFERFKLYKLKQRTNRVVALKVRALRDRWGKPTEGKVERKKNRLARLEVRKQKAAAAQ